MTKANYFFSVYKYISRGQFLKRDSGFYTGHTSFLDPDLQFLRDSKLE